MDERIIPPHMPWVTHAAAGCYVIPPLFWCYAFVHPAGAQPTLLPSLVLLTIAVAFTGINIWALYRPNPLNRWIPLCTAVISAISVVMVRVLVVPKPISSDHADYALSVLLVYESLVFFIAATGGLFLLQVSPRIHR